MSKHVGLGAFLEVAMLKKCTPLWREGHLEVKSVRTPQLRTAFGSCDVEKVHAVQLRATFGSSDVEKVHGVVARSTFSVRMLKLPHDRATF